LIEQHRPISRWSSFSRDIANIKSWLDTRIAGTVDPKLANMQETKSKRIRDLMKQNQRKVSDQRELLALFGTVEEKTKDGVKYFAIQAEE
jgi:hypothetical protein